MTILDSREYARQVRLSSNTIKVKIGGSLNVLNKENVTEKKKDNINNNSIILKNNTSLMISSKNNISLDKTKKSNKINIGLKNNSLNVSNKDIINKNIIALDNIQLIVKGKKNNKLLRNYHNIILRNKSLNVSRVDKPIVNNKPRIINDKLRALNNNPTLIVNKKLSTENNKFTIDSKDVIIETNVTKANGIDSLSVTISAGKKCLIRIKEKDSIINVKYIKGLPSSLYFDEVDSTIKGIAFITGEHLVRIGLDSGMEVRLLIIVVPDDILKVL